MLQPAPSSIKRFKVEKEKSPPSLSTQQHLEKLVEEACAVAKTKEIGVINTGPPVKKARWGIVESHEQNKGKKLV